MGQANAVASPSCFSLYRDPAGIGLAARESSGLFIVNKLVVGSCVLQFGIATSRDERQPGNRDPILDRILLPFPSLHKEEGADNVLRQVCTSQR